LSEPCDPAALRTRSQAPRASGAPTRASARSREDDRLASEVERQLADASTRLPAALTDRESDPMAGAVEGHLEAQGPRTQPTGAALPPRGEASEGEGRALEAPSARHAEGRGDHERRPPATIEEYLAASLNRQADLADLVQRLFARIEEQQILLASALHELYAAVERPGLSRDRFINNWYADKRKRMS
jgi:hypothetical protein